MKRINFLMLIFAFCIGFSCNYRSADQEQASKITFKEDNAGKKIDVFIDGQLFTSFLWIDNLTKPVFYPILTPKGNELTRGFPLHPRSGERTDHPHQIGMWLTYGNVNGLDFWGNGSGGLGTQNPNGGIVKHLKTEKLSEGTGEGSFITNESWTNPTGIELLNELTEFTFITKGDFRIIDRKTLLTAGENKIDMPDTKEGMFGIRVALQLELPSDESMILYNANNTTSRIYDTVNIGNTGNYLSSEGLSGEEVWGTRAPWMHLSGIINDEKISLVIFDHFNNPNYPTYWHARPYGLFAANPFGVKDFTRGKDSLNFSIAPGQSIAFRYRVIIASGEHLQKEKINKMYNDFSLKYKN